MKEDEPTEELKPCPFCGMTGPLERVSVGDTEIIERDRCQMSGPHVRSALPHEVTKHWNTRDDDWQPIEKAPKDGTLVDLWSQGMRWPSCYLDGQDDDMFWRCDWHDEHPENPTHFRHLPQPPKEDQ